MSGCANTRGASSFNPRARVGRDHRNRCRRHNRQRFQSTRPRGARRLICRKSRTSPSFQSTRPRGARREVVNTSIRQYEFQSTRPRGARLFRPLLERRVLEFQSTRPRGARHPERRTSTGKSRDVSIHAPAWGATDRLAVTATIPAFQSTRPRGARRDGRGVVGRDRAVSIHAPAWGATRRTPGARLSDDCFNPRARVGRDSIRMLCVCVVSSFNPRARVGRDVVERGKRRFMLVSIHAPAWGATMATGSIRWAQAVSIHAPAWGATGDGSHCLHRSGCFNPRARVGRDLAMYWRSWALDSFNPRARVGRDVMQLGTWLSTPRFNPRARVGRDLAAGCD